MPKVVDHEQRREELAAAVWRIAAHEGLEAVTVRRVADEAGWSTGALVHYFSDKEELLLFAFRTGADRVGRRLAATEARTADPLELARAMLAEGLPLDRARQEEVRVWFAFLGLALTRPVLARAQRVTYRSWRDRVAEYLGAAQRDGAIRRRRGPGRRGGGARRARRRDRGAGELRAAPLPGGAPARAGGHARGRAARVVASSR